MRGWIMNIGLLLLLTSATTFTDIQWETERKLDWSDFREASDHSHDHDALTTTAISMSYTTKETHIDFDVYTIFSKDHSWVKPAAKTTRLLQHEQLHFDIAELFTRKLRYKILTMDIVSDEKINLAYDEILNEMIAMQTLYDKESHHSLNRKSQKEWNEKISNRLKFYQAYTSARFKKSLPVVANN